MQDIADNTTTSAHGDSVVPWMIACHDFFVAVSTWKPDDALTRVKDTYDQLRAYSQACLRRELRMAEVLALASDRGHEEETDVVIFGHVGYHRKDVLVELFPGRVQLVPTPADGTCLVIRKQP
ncbi:hypothetical protein AB1Y20_008516 [Prymnesium parvum]|uniref:Protein-serine/threonine phosphatase n=1 Tax=Prymnesium parvum TaxID=97485 RepID=A0AB34ISP2_PRYPA